jgi:redox-sensitive bicupin YhaK (pirin superfamily)
MSAGTGINHSEYNASQTEPVHFLQTWIIPDQTGLKPGYEQQSFALDTNLGKWTLVGSKEGRDGSVTVHQAVELYLAAISQGQELNYRLKPGRQAWLQVTRGAATLNGVALDAGDGVAVSQEDLLNLAASDDTELLLFDLP